MNVEVLVEELQSPTENHVAVDVEGKEENGETHNRRQTDTIVFLRIIYNTMNIVLQVPGLYTCVDLRLSGFEVNDSTELPLAVHVPVVSWIVCPSPTRTTISVGAMFSI